MVRSHNEVFLIIHQRMEPILVGPVVSEDIVCGGGEGAEEVIWGSLQLQLRYVPTETFSLG